MVRALLAASLAVLLVGTALSTAPRAEAGVYWGSSGFVGAANLDGSTFVDGVPYRAANVPEIGNICGLTVSNGYLYWADSSRGTIGRMELSFDTDFDHPMESVLMGHPESEIPFCVRDYRIVDERGETVYRREGNYQTQNTIRFTPALTAAELTLEILKTHGAPAAVFAIRCYPE